MLIILNQQSKTSIKQNYFSFWNEFKERNVQIFSLISIKNEIKLYQK